MVLGVPPLVACCVRLLLCGGGLALCPVFVSSVSCLRVACLWFSCLWPPCALLLSAAVLSAMVVVLCLVLLFFLMAVGSVRLSLNSWRGAPAPRAPFGFYY